MVLMGCALAACRCHCGAVSGGSSGQVQTRHEVVWERDTVLVQLPETHVEQTADTLSVIERDGITTTARLTDKGITHTLDVDVTEAVEVLARREVRDSVAVTERVVEVEVAKPLGWWERAQIWLGRVLLLGLLAVAAWKIYRRRKGS